ncbi:hypothetical protein HFRIS_013590 [Herbaspirillum frisingense GSF30]|uniref:Uncharacterized protein n=1 Tax=Herbaspirillum frisingense GSF30 TaxID=864073 RepID=A0AAI9IDC5_9BURK|nr:hypothetical protein HFRIS_013590 [Herbaspirillum frisingense GSF30]
MHVPWLDGWMERRKPHVKHPCTIRSSTDDAGQGLLGNMMEAVRMIALRESLKNLLLAGLRAGGMKSQGLRLRGQAPSHAQAQWRSACPSSLTVAGAAPALAARGRVGRTGFPFESLARLRAGYQKQC